jgi:Bacterial SH3 domain
MKVALSFILSLLVGFLPAWAALAEGGPYDGPCGSNCKEMIRRQQNEQPREPDAIDNAFGALILGLGAAALAESYGKGNANAARPRDNGYQAPGNFLWAHVEHPDGGDLKLRDGPGFDYPTIAILGNGERLKVLGCKGYDGERAWCLVEAGGDRGWASSKYLTRDD